MPTNPIKIIQRIYANFRNAARNLNSSFPYEIANVTSCRQSGKHLLDIKITGKCQGIHYLAEEIASDDAFLESFSPTDIRMICYLAACDKYEKILEKEKIKKIYSLLRSSSINGKKSIQLHNKINDEITVIPLREFIDRDIIEKLDPNDVYQVGYMAGQEQTMKDMAKIKVISNNHRKGIQMSVHSYTDPDKYSKNNSLQFDFAMRVISKIRIDKSANILDLGCGDGAITKVLADTAVNGHVVGTDISEQMINFATRKYSDISNLEFLCMDAGNITYKNQFDLITSFNALHWVKDQQSALQGIANAAVKNADIVLLLSHKKSIYHHTLDKISQNNTWVELFKDYINPRSFFEIHVYKEMLEKAGLNVISITEEEMTYYFENRESLKEFYRGSMANHKQLPDNRKEEFLDDVCKEYLSQLNHKEHSPIPVSFWCLVVIAKSI